MSRMSQLPNSVELIRRAKSESIKVTAEVTPHHLAHTERWVYGENGNVPDVLTENAYDTQAKMAPPLRTDRRSTGAGRGIG